MKSNLPPSRTPYRVFALLSLVLVVMLVLLARQRQRPGDGPAPAPAAPVPPAEDLLSTEGTELPVDLGNIPAVEARNLARRPGRIPGALQIPTEARQALQMQTRMLLDEQRDPSANPDEQRALTIPEEEIRQLEKEGRMIF